MYSSFEKSKEKDGFWMKFSEKRLYDELFIEICSKTLDHEILPSRTLR